MDEQEVWVRLIERMVAKDGDAPWEAAVADAYVAEWRKRYAAPEKPAEPATAFKVGDRVRHAKYGHGEIREFLSGCANVKWDEEADGFCSSFERPEELTLDPTPPQR